MIQAENQLSDRCCHRGESLLTAEAIMPIIKGNGYILKRFRHFVKFCDFPFIIPYTKQIRKRHLLLWKEFVPWENPIHKGAKHFR